MNHLENDTDPLFLLLNTFYCFLKSIFQFYVFAVGCFRDFYY